MIKWLKIDVMIESQDKAPFFVGSMFRGALGMALKKVVCINPSYTCEGCFAAKECLYYQFYEEKNVFHAYRLGIEIQPKGYDFSLYLFEDAIDALPSVLAALQKAVEEQGFGKERKTMKIRQMSVFNTIVYDGNTFQPLDTVMANTIKIDSYCPNVELEFTMPLRIKENNKFAKESVALHTLVNNIHSRYRQLKGETPARMDYRVEGEIVTEELKFVEMQRYSNRQKKGMSMGGLKGKMMIKGIDRKSYEYLKIGEIIGAGKQTVFGLGSYTIKEMK
jgi:hypothetical protein